HNGVLSLTDDQGDRIAAFLQGNTVTGLVDVDGLGSHTFTADRAVDGESGLFRGVGLVNGEEDVVSLIRLGDSSRGNVRNRITGIAAWINDSPPPPPPPPPPPKQ